MFLLRATVKMKVLGASFSMEYRHRLAPGVGEYYFSLHRESSPYFLHRRKLTTKMGSISLIRSNQVRTPCNTRQPLPLPRSFTADPRRIHTARSIGNQRNAHDWAQRLMLDFAGSFPTILFAGPHRPIALDGHKPAQNC